MSDERLEMRRELYDAQAKGLTKMTMVDGVPTWRATPAGRKAAGKLIDQEIAEHGPNAAAVIAYKMGVALEMGEGLVSERLDDIAKQSAQRDA